MRHHAHHMHNRCFTIRLLFCFNVKADRNGDMMHHHVCPPTSGSAPHSHLCTCPTETPETWPMPERHILASDATMGTAWNVTICHLRVCEDKMSPLSSSLMEQLYRKKKEKKKRSPYSLSKAGIFIRATRCPCPVLLCARSQCSLAVLLYNPSFPS